MSIAIDPEVLLDARRVLLRAELSLTAVRPVAPETGDTADLTDAAVGRVAAVVGALATDCHELADALSGLLDDLGQRDDRVGLWFDLLRVRSLA